ncbi:type VI secretion system-associated protein TagF [Chitinibacter sp. ZOR0017]|uniref:type VI secretion system-associated protein TagF n=1 Tax=Chitinibacter sp. ZOR0017 TaxID=1339254 RepID=UPI000647AFCF|nr:type VI secretion system-associated protein TagF [Chitinibacter sp. ZOR0017]
MPFNLKKNHEQQLQYAVFGKLPRRADFIRINAGHPMVQDVDQRFARSLADITVNPEWVEAYLGHGPSEFMLRSQDGKWSFLGVVHPSQDEAGRKYPLSAGVCVPGESLTGAEALYLLANELFYTGLRDQLSSAIDNSVEMLACKQFLEEQISFSARSAADIDLAEQLLQRYMSQLSSQTLGQRLQAAGLQDLESTLLAFMFYLKLVQRFGAGMSPQVFVLPLPAQQGEAILGAAVWLDLYRTATEFLPAHPINLALITRAEQKYLVLSPAEFDQKTIQLFWGADLQLARSILAQGQVGPWCSHQRYAEAAYVLGRQLSDPSLNVLKLKAVVRQIASNID